MESLSLFASFGQLAARPDAAQLLALAAALGWASGVRLYASVFIVGLAGALGWIDLPQGLQVIAHPGVLAAAGFMLVVEFFADKIPYLDSLWDLLHTFIRIPAGAALAAGALGADGPAMAWIAAVLGGSLAATSHATKLSTRAAVNTSPEPFTNIGVSLLEDGFVVLLLWLAVTHPVLFAWVMAATLLTAITLLVLLFKFLRAVLRKWSGRSESPVVNPYLVSAAGPPPRALPDPAPARERS